MELLKLLYSIDENEWLEGYDLYQKLYKRRSVYIKAAIFLIPLILFIQQIWLDPHFTMGYVCIAVCLAAIVCILLTPSLERKNVMRALSGISGDMYQLTLFADKLTVETVAQENRPENLEPDGSGGLIRPENPAPTVIGFDDRSMKVIETEKIFGIFTKQTSIVLPKREMNDHDAETIRKTLNRA